ncbi:MAG TPA: hypothetical protein VNW94_26905 [Streptosporangiaceae bacterium]|nr:hypothetical protein [Streptosporangiaceae bacterium]
MYRQVLDPLGSPALTALVAALPLLLLLVLLGVLRIKLPEIVRELPGHRRGFPKFWRRACGHRPAGSSQTLRST